jgi:hypothetical protein
LENILNHVRFHVLTVMSMKMAVFRMFHCVVW